MNSLTAISTMPKISFIIPCYNVEQFVGRTINSIYEQQLSEEQFEIIAVNDGSTDCTLDFLMHIDKANFRVIDQENMGLSGARNTGMDVADGEYIWFIDSDDYINSGEINSLLSLMDKHCLDILIFGMEEHRNGRINHVTHNEITNNVVLSGKDAILGGYKPNSVCAAIYRNDFLKRNPDLKFYPKLYHQDVQFNYRAIAKAKRIMFVPNTPYVYVVRSGSISTSTTPQNVIKRCNDNGIIAISFIEFSKTVHDNDVRRRFEAQAKSIVVGTFFGLLKIKNKDIRKQIIDFHKKQQLFPIRAPFSSIKQRMCCLFMNIYFSIKC